MAEERPLILASTSPRRRELVEMLGVPFTVEAPDVDESLREGEAPATYVERVAREKATTVAARHEAGVVVAADTIVVHEGKILGKPRDPSHAREMLHRLRGQQHLVLTATAIADASTGKVISDICESKVTIRGMSDEEIDAYIASDDPTDKAAGYAIQNLTFAPVEQVVGCPANVMGLPMCHTVRSLRRQGRELPPSQPLDCRIQYGYYCEITDEVMPGLTEKGIIPSRK